MKNIYIASCDEKGGIYHCRMANSKLEIIEKTELDRPMFLTACNNKLYAVIRDMGNGTSGVCSFDIATDGSLTNQSDIASTGGVVSCHIAVEGENIYTANYLSGNVTLLPNKLSGHSGKGVNSARQDAPHMHFVGFTPDKKYLAVTDLGLDKIFFYDKDLNEQFHLSVPPGYGARHLVFSEDRKYLYCANELISSVSTFKYVEKQSEYIDTVSALPSDFSADNLAAAIRIHKGKLYVSNRGHNSIAVFNADSEIPTLEKFITVGKEPRDFDIISEHLISCNMGEDTVSLHSIDGKKLQELSLKTPLCVLEA